MSLSGWFPIAASHDLPFRHVFHGQLLGREFAVWRADDGYVNIWENRCLHRGVRLSIGINDGRELKCQYHGWRYSNRTAGCTYIPAHPADAPARTINIRTFPVSERYGLVWSSVEAVDGEPTIPALDQKTTLALRGIAVNAPASLALEHLQHYRFQPTDALSGDDAQVALVHCDDVGVILRSCQSDAQTLAVFLVQPVDSKRCVIRGVLDSDPIDRERLAVFRHHNERLCALREELERKAASLAVAPSSEPVHEPVSPELAELPPLAPEGRGSSLNVRVARKWQAARDIVGFELRALRGHLPTFQPGAHIDVHLPNGQVRQYSIVNALGETDSYVIGVKREVPSRGGSQCLHEVVREGDVLAISEPRNNFPMRRDAVRTIFIAGGIGVTPLLAMAQALQHSNLAYELHYFVRSEDGRAFPERLATLRDHLTTHLDLTPAATEERIRAVLSNYRPRMQIYVCGPPSMLDATRHIASELGWPESQVHFEYFKNTHVIDDSSRFEIALARSVVTLEVPPGKTILQVLRDGGISIPSSCEQGACGTCVATVLEGDPDHQDVYLTDSERRSGTKIITCVSRAKSVRLVLDL
jgi:ferredoxin-NADP reductase/phenylpropionate dioxygenase-like ring-hydroxylating dioxygenase large terminal subunit